MHRQHHRTRARRGIVWLAAIGTVALAACVPQTPPSDGDLLDLGAVGRWSEPTAEIIGTVTTCTPQHGVLTSTSLLVEAYGAQNERLAYFKMACGAVWGAPAEFDGPYPPLPTPGQYSFFPDPALSTSFGFGTDARGESMVGELSITEITLGPAESQQCAGSLYRITRLRATGWAIDNGGFGFTQVSLSIG